MKALRMTVNLATTRHGRHRLRNSVFCDITATFVHASIDEVVGISPHGKALCGNWVASKWWQRHYMRMLGMREQNKTILGFLFLHRDHAGPCGCLGSDIMAEGSDEAVQAGRFSLKEVSTDSNGGDLTTKCHDGERRNVLMTLSRLRYTRGRGNALSTVNEGQSAAVVNAVVNATWMRACGARRWSFGREGPKTACLNCTGWAPVW